MEFAVTRPEVLDKLCVENDWLNALASENYGRLSYANKNGFSISDIASIIWACSDVNIHSWYNIFRLLTEEHDKYLASLGRI